MSPKIVDKSAKRKDIIRSAMVVCARQGVHNFKMTEIANAAGVGKGTLYEYFTDKEELVSGCYELFLDDYNNYLGTRLTAISDPKEKIELIIKGGCEFFVKNSGNVEIMIDFWAAIIHSRNDQFLKSGGSGGFSQVINEVSNIIREGIKKGIFRPVDPKLTSNMLFALLDGLYLQSILGLIKIDSHSLPQKISRMYLEGILK